MRFPVMRTALYVRIVLVEAIAFWPDKRLFALTSPACPETGGRGSFHRYFWMADIWGGA